jgi:hypothetical protein
MKRAISGPVLVVFVGLACGNEEAAAPAAPDAGGATEATSSKVDLKPFETAFSEIVQTKRTGDNTKRRDQCLAQEPKVSEAAEKHTTDPKLQQFVSQFAQYCPEAVEARKLMKKASEKGPAMPELSAAMKSMFTEASLKTDLKKAKAIAKKKGDPEESCKKIMLTTHVVGEKKKQTKKTKKLLKEATAFCEGSAIVAAIGFHLREAEKAEKADQPADLSAHCTAALTKMNSLKAGKSKPSFEESMKTVCREVYALKPMLDSRGS